MGRERLLGIPIPPPPPNVPPVDPDTRGARTLREQLAMHGSKGSCAACHARFDPFGFALESFDVTGAFRTRYRVADLRPRERQGTWRDGLPVDSTGETPPASPSPASPICGALASNPAQLARGVTRHLITYATGRRDAHRRARDRGHRRGRRRPRLRPVPLVHGVVQSETFRWK